jgi:hypothetical protein
MSKLYVKKPIKVAAFRFGFDQIPEWMYRKTWIVHEDKDHEYLMIHTLEGDMRAEIGDYIIKGIKDEIYPCKLDIFKASYNEAIPLIEEDFV